MKQRKTLSGWLTSRYMMIIRNEEDFAEKNTFYFTYARLIVYATLIFIIIFGLAFLLIKTVLAQWVDPAYAQQKNTERLLVLGEQLDSIKRDLQRNGTAIDIVRTAMNGGEGYEDSVNSSESQIDPDQINIDYRSPIDSAIRKEFEGQDYNLTFSHNKEAELIDMLLFKPIEGVITQDFLPQKDHFAIDIVAKTDEPVKSTASGTVIMASWTEDSGNVLMVQHKNNLTSVYKHNAVVLKKPGEYVEAGEIIAIVGNSGELTSGPHLHFELWHNGKPINPLNYINY